MEPRRRAKGVFSPARRRGLCHRTGLVSLHPQLHSGGPPACDLDLPSGIRRGHRRRKLVDQPGARLQSHAESAGLVGRRAVLQANLIGVDQSDLRSRRWGVSPHGDGRLHAAPAGDALDANRRRRRGRRQHVRRMSIGASRPRKRRGRHRRRRGRRAGRRRRDGAAQIGRRRDRRGAWSCRRGHDHRGWPDGDHGPRRTRTEEDAAKESPHWADRFTRVVNISSFGSTSGNKSWPAHRHRRPAWQARRPHARTAPWCRQRARRQGREPARGASIISLAQERDRRRPDDPDR